MKLCLVLGCVFFYCIVRGNAEEIVNIPSLGEIRGSFMTSASGRQFSAFRGIPFAKPPVDQLRFKVLRHDISKF